MWQGPAETYVVIADHHSTIHVATWQRHRETYQTSPRLIVV